MREASTISKHLGLEKSGYSYKGSKIPFSGNREVIHHIQGVLEAFKLFFDDALMSQITNETNRYGREFINSKQDNLPPRSRVHDWHNVDSDELYVHFALQMLMGIVQKPSVKSYFTKNPILDTPIFYKTPGQI